MDVRGGRHCPGGEPHRCDAKGYNGLLLQTQIDLMIHRPDISIRTFLDHFRSF